VIEINKDTDFFNDPSPALQSVASYLFSVLGVIGWLLGAVLVIAFSKALELSQLEPNPHRVFSGEADEF
jgi:hypothetical protein